MISTILFDLDGVLVDAKEIHFQALNKALESYAISWDEHLSIYDGLKTSEKLELLNKLKKLPVENFTEIWNKKQEYTSKLLENVDFDPVIYDTVVRLSVDGFKLGVCSNSIRRTVMTVLSKLGIVQYFDIILSNEDIKKSKPYPYIYWKGMYLAGSLPEETLIIEDSPHGLLSAWKSKANVLRVRSCKEITYNSICNEIENLNFNMHKDIPKWKDKDLNILIPMAGAGSRFARLGYTVPKPIIPVEGIPMIKLVVDNLNLEGNYTFIVQKSHVQEFKLDTILELIVPNCNIIQVEGTTEGAACTALLAKDFINNNSPLFISNCDQFVSWNSNEFMYKMNETNCDGGIVTFTSTSPKWSFVKIRENGNIVEVAEKNPISSDATVGFYYWKHGKDFVHYAEKMIQSNKRVNNEFYICPVYNEAINDNKQIKSFQAREMWGLGTPEDLELYLKRKK